MNPVERVNCINQSSPDKALAIIFVNDSDQEFNPGSDLCKLLEKRQCDHVSQFEVSKLDECVRHCLSEHDAVVIVDSTFNGTRVGTVSLVDLSLLNRRGIPLTVPSSHGKMIASELNLAREAGRLPERLLLLGVEGPPPKTDEKFIPSKDECASLNTASLILSTLLKTLNKRAS